MVILSKIPSNLGGWYYPWHLHGDYEMEQMQHYKELLCGGFQDMFGNLAITNPTFFFKRITWGKYLLRSFLHDSSIIQAICRTLCRGRGSSFCSSRTATHSNAPFCDSPRTPVVAVCFQTSWWRISSFHGGTAWLTALPKETCCPTWERTCPLYQLQTVESMRPPFLSRFWKKWTGANVKQIKLFMDPVMDKPGKHRFNRFL